MHQISYKDDLWCIQRWSIMHSHFQPKILFYKGACDVLEYLKQIQLPQPLTAFGWVNHLENYMKNKKTTLIIKTLS